MRRALLASTLAVLVPLAGCGGGAEPPAPAAIAYRGATLSVQPRQTTDWRDVSATVTSVDQAQAMARIPGILTTLTVREGDRVAKGQVIGRIVDSHLGYQAGAYGAQAAAAEAQAGQARAELARVQFLYDRGVYAQARLDQAQAGARAAEAQIRAARAQQAAVSAVAGQGAVTAPSAGRVLTASVPAGSAVAPGMVIATITSGAIVLRLDLPEGLAATIRPGATVIADFGDGTKRQGSVTTLYPAVAGGVVAADVAMSGLDDRLIGRRVSARIAAGQRAAILVPRRAIKTAFGTDSVRLVGKDGAVATVPVQIAATPDPDRVEILSGVAAGDRLAIGTPQ